MKSAKPAAGFDGAEGTDSTLAPRVVLVGEVGSALDEAHALAAAGGLPEWGSVLARAQTSGRGQLRRHWHSPEGNLYAALRLPLEPPFVGSEAAPALGALAAAALESVCRTPDSRPHVRLKWPNDLVCLHHDVPYKVGGILLEERNGCLLAGMGLNVCHAPPVELLRQGCALPAGTLQSLDFLGKSAMPESPESPAALAEALWRRLVRSMYFWYAKELRTPSRWLALAEERLLWKNRTVFLGDGEEGVRGTLLGLAPSGEIRLAMEGGVREFSGGSLRAI